MSDTVSVRQQPQVQLRPRLDTVTASQPFANPKRLKIYHPAYPHATPLFDIPAFDCDGNIPGMHFSSILTICGIVAGNRWDGWLQEKGSDVKIDMQPDAVLPAKNYEYYLPYPDESAACTLPYRYAIIPSFSQYLFPHDNAPPGWDLREENQCYAFNRNFITTTRSNLSQAVCARDQFRCHVTQEQDITECAHVVPRKENEWFIEQGMSRYRGSGGQLAGAFVEDVANSFTLRQDIHTMFDKQWFVFLPKCGGFVPHFFSATAQAGQQYHNRPVDLPGVHPAFLLVRLAWAVFPSLYPFPLQNKTCLLRLKRESTSDWEDVEISYFELVQRAPDLPAPSRSQSPKKRQKASGDGHESDDDDQRDRKRLRAYHTPSSLPSTEQNGPISLGALATGIPAEDIAPENGSLVTVSSADESDDKDNVFDIPRLRAMGRKALLKQRRENSSMQCCDYDANDEFYRLLKLGVNVQDWPSLCLQCRGAEVLDLGSDEEECSVTS